MARLTGPLHSDTASGTFAKSLVFASWKGRAYARERVIPANPKSAGQTGIRAMMKYLAQLWGSLGAVTQATWDDIAASRSISAFNAFVGHNLSRWQLTKAPTQAYPAAESHTALSVDSVANDGVILAATGHAGYATMGALPDSVDNSVAVAAIIFRGSAAPSLDWAAAIAVVPVTPGDAWTYTDSPLAAATYHYKIAYISDDGVISALSAADVNAVVT